MKLHKPTLWALGVSGVGIYYVSDTSTPVEHLVILGILLTFLTVSMEIIARK